MRSGVRRLDDRADSGPNDRAPVSEPEPALLELQRGAGNAAVTRMLARDFTFNPVRPEARPNPLDPGTAAAAILADHDAPGCSEAAGQPRTFSRFVALV